MRDQGASRGSCVAGRLSSLTPGTERALRSSGKCLQWPELDYFFPNLPGTGANSTIRRSGVQECVRGKQENISVEAWMHESLM